MDVCLSIDRLPCQGKLRVLIGLVIVSIGQQRSSTQLKNCLDLENQLPILVAMSLRWLVFSQILMVVTLLEQQSVTMLHQYGGTLAVFLLDKVLADSNDQLVQLISTAMQNQPRLTLATVFACVCIEIMNDINGVNCYHNMLITNL